jgi:Na+-transporting NADH:ubiquinone oxidoreductase subunit C
MEFTPARTVGFATIVCFVCSIFVAGAAVGLKDRQIENEILDRQKKVLAVANLLPNEIASDIAQIKKAYNERVQPVLVDLKPDGCKDQKPNDFDQQKFAKDPKISTDVIGNKAKV